MKEKLSTNLQYKMELIQSKVDFLHMTENPLETIEKSARICYKSEEAIKEGSAERLVKMLVKHGHNAMLEHAIASYKITCDRGVSHEIVRHRIASYAQESTRYCNYSKDKRGMIFIKPFGYDGWDRNHKESFREFLELAEKEYNNMINKGFTPQQARAVLPNAVKTEIVMTLNFRSWLNFFKLRCAKDAHPDIRVIANTIREDLSKKVPIIFEEE